MGVAKDIRLPDVDVGVVNRASGSSSWSNSVRYELHGLSENVLSMLIQPVDARSSTIGRETRRFATASMSTEEQEVPFRQQSRKEDADDTESLRTRPSRQTTHNEFAVF